MSAVSRRRWSATASGRGRLRRTLEDLDAELVGHAFGLLVDGHVEAEDDGQLLGLLEHSRSAHDILLVHRTDVDARDLRSEARESATNSFRLRRKRSPHGNLARPQELEQGLE